VTPSTRTSRPVHQLMWSDIVILSSATLQRGIPRGLDEPFHIEMYVAASTDE